MELPNITQAKDHVLNLCVVLLCTVKVWSLTGGLVETFRSHSRSVTNLLLHPDDSSLVLSSSLDGSVKVWSLDIMELMYS